MKKLIYSIAASQSLEWPGKDFQITIEVLYRWMYGHIHRILV